MMMNYNHEQHRTIYRSINQFINSNIRHTTVQTIV
jgi:hypothetical protein